MKLGGICLIGTPGESTKSPVGCVGNSRRKANKWKFQKEMFEDVHEGAYMKWCIKRENQINNSQ